MEQIKSKIDLKKIGVYALKIIVAAVILYAVYSKIPLDQFKEDASKISIVTLLFAMFFFALSMVISSLRLTFFIRDINVPISYWSNGKLYLLGMFYNLFLPGGVGGDAYKIYHINANYSVKTKESFWPFLMDRGSGLFAILVLILVCALFIDIQLIPNQKLILLGLIAFGFLAVFVIVKLIRPIHLKSFFKTMPLSFLVQMSQGVCVYLFISAIGVTDKIIEYLFLFFVSSVATIIPITPGGAGLREVTYQLGSKYLYIEPKVGVFVGTLFFIVTLVVSFSGIIYHFRKIERKK